MKTFIDFLPRETSVLLLPVKHTSKILNRHETLEQSIDSQITYEVLTSNHKTNWQIFFLFRAVCTSVSQRA